MTNYDKKHIIIAIGQTQPTYKATTMSEKKDFNQIVRELLECYTQTELSKTTGVDQATISRLKNGKERKGLTYDSGAALVELYEKHKEKK